MHSVKANVILSAKNEMNLYRGCSHGCIYCDSRSKCCHTKHAFENKIVIHEREKKDGKRTQKIDICYSYVGIADIPRDEEMWEMQQYMQRTTRQTA